MSTKSTFVVGGPDKTRSKTNATSLWSAYKGLDFSKRWKVTIEKYVRKNTSSQKGLYFKWCDLIAEETGSEKDDVHEFATETYCPIKTVEVAGKTVDVRSIKHLNTIEMNTYMTRVQAWAATDLHITLPLPEDQGGEG